MSLACGAFPLRLFTGVVTVVALLVGAESHAVIRYTGVNLSGAEFGATPTPGNLGTYGSAYTYPTAAEVNYYVGKGMNVFRLPFRWERMQPTQAGPLATLELQRMDAFVNYATSHGAHVIIEPHNFQRYYPDPGNFQQSSQGLVGSAVPDSALVDFWTKMADHYKGNGKVIFNLMNEPANVSVSQLLNTTNQVIVGIRGTGATNLIQVPGTSYTGAWTWTTSGNSATMINVVDPADNYSFEVHQYFDNDGSGTSPQIGTNGNPNNINIGVQRLTAMTNWLKANNKRAFLGEFAFANSRFGEPDGTGNSSKIADEAMQALLDYMVANDDVWEGWSWWGGGPWWDSGDYMFGLGPDNRNYVSPVGESPALPYLAPYYAQPITDDLVGDFNLDRIVDGGDLKVFNVGVKYAITPNPDPANPDHYANLTGTNLAGDANEDGQIDGADILLWQANLFSTAPKASPAVGAVPEPSAIALAASSLGVVAVWRRRLGADRN